MDRFSHQLNVETQKNLQNYVFRQNSFLKFQKNSLLISVEHIGVGARRRMYMGRAKNDWLKWPAIQVSNSWSSPLWPFSTWPMRYRNHSGQHKGFLYYFWLANCFFQYLITKNMQWAPSGLCSTDTKFALFSVFR